MPRYRYTLFATDIRFLHGLLYVREDNLQLVRANLTSLEVTWKEIKLD